MTNIFSTAITLVFRVLHVWCSTIIIIIIIAQLLMVIMISAENSFFIFLWKNK